MKLSNFKYIAVYNTPDRSMVYGVSETIKPLKDITKKRADGDEAIPEEISGWISIQICRGRDGRQIWELTREDTTWKKSIH